MIKLNNMKKIVLLIPVAAAMLCSSCVVSGPPVGVYGHSYVIAEPNYYSAPTVAPNHFMSSSYGNLIVPQPMNSTRVSYRGGRFAGSVAFRNYYCY